MRFRAKELFSTIVIIISIIIILGGLGYLGYNQFQNYVEDKQEEVGTEIVRGMEDDGVGEFWLNNVRYVCIEYEEEGR